MDNPQADTLYGRHRQSVAEIDEELHNIFREHPECYENEQGKSVLPAKCLPDIFDTYAREFGVELMTRDEMQSMVDIVEKTPGLEATPDMLLQFVAMRSSSNPDDEEERGRNEDRHSSRQSRSSSANSNGTYYSGSRPPSRPPSRGSQVPPSPFDAQKRQRTTPIGSTAPSSWTKRPVAPARRKSDAGSNPRNVSDSESSANTSFSRSTSGRRRTPSTGYNSAQRSATVSPDSSFDLGPPSAEGPYSRPHSRSNSHPQGIFGDMVRSPKTSDDRAVPPPLDLSRSAYDALYDSVSTLPMPRASGDDDSDEEVESALGLVMERSAASSIISMEPDERLDVLQKANHELSKKLMENERILQNRLADHELELEEMQQKLDETRAELSAAKREEKELRGKERSHSQQISVLELEVSKLQKSLETSRTSYSNLQRQYQEQLNESEALRNQLRRKDEQIHEFGNSLSLMELEQSKAAKERDQYEDRIMALQREIEIAQETQRSLDEQKHENLMLKETIDRMRFDMDELRNGLTSHASQSGGSSLPGSVSKSLGAELLSKMQDDQDWTDNDVADITVQEAEIEVEGSGDEHIIERIITRKKKRGLSKANIFQTTMITDDREYADAYTQYDPTFFQHASSVQTDPEPRVLTASLSVQTEITVSASAIQTDELLPKPTADAGVQTDVVDTIQERSRLSSPQPDEEDSLASSSSTILPPTPKAKSSDIVSTDLPPSYNDAASQSLYHNLEHILEATDLSFSHVNDPEARRELIAAAAALKRCHKGLCLPMQKSGAPLSAEAAAEWHTLKQELGISCAVIDKAVAEADLVPRKDKGSPRRGRFYNIYNTYVYGAGAEATNSGVAPWMSQLLVAGVASVVVFAAMSPFLVQNQSVPGGPTYYDRAAWQSFNSMQGGGEGFATDGSAAVWNFLGRLGGGAARVVRNWPT